MAIPDSRDSTTFGGKIGKSVDGRTVSYPYFYPFSVPTLSLMRRDMRERASYEWQQFNIGLVGYLNERMGREMMIGDLEARGYGVPYTSIPESQSQLEIPSAETPVLAYLKHVQDATPVLMQSIEQK